MDIRALRQRKAELVAAGRAILDKAKAEGRALTEEENASFESTHAELEKVETGIARLQRQLEAERRAGFADEDETPDKRRDGFASLGEQLAAVVRAERSSATEFDPRLLAAPTGLGETFPSEGGFLVQPTFSTEILQRTYQVGEILSRVRDFPMSSNSHKIPAIDESSRADNSRYGGVRVQRVAEAGTPTAGKPKFARIELDLKKLMGLVYATEDLLEDTTALEALINAILPEELSFKMEDEFINGDGANGALGILNAACLVTVAKETGQLANTVVYENIVNMWARMWGRSRRNAVWLINQDVEPQLFTMGITLGTGGSPVFLPPSGASQSPFSTLFGRPVIPVEYCATLGTVGDIILADFSQYLHGRKGGIRADSSMHVRFLNDEMTFRFVLRNDGQPWWRTALTPFKGSNTQSPFVALATRA